MFNKGRSLYITMKEREELDAIQKEVVLAQKCISKESQTAIVPQRDAKNNGNDDCPKQ